MTRAAEYRVIFPEQDRVELEKFVPDRVGQGSVAVRTRYTLISTGTELTVLGRRYEAGGHWDKWTRFPYHPGYAAVGEVVELGPGVEELALGELVALRAGHATYHVVPSFHCFPVPAQVEPELAPWFAFAKIAFIGARAAGYSLGDAVLIIGAGPIGQMSVRWAHAAGARAVAVVDPFEDRLNHARRGGATAVAAKPASAAAEDVYSAVGAEGPDVVIDSTGHSEVFAAALALVRTHGRVVVLGDTGTPTAQHLTSDVIVRGITVVGAHDAHSVPSSNWDGDRSIHSLFFHLVTTGRFDLNGLNSHIFDPHDCAAAYTLAREQRADTLGLVFDWTHA